MVTELGNGLFNDTLHVISQSLLIPVMIVLAIFFIYSLINMGIIIAEYYKKRNNKMDVKDAISKILSFRGQRNSNGLINMVETLKIPQNHKNVLITLLNTSEISQEYRESLALKMVEDEGITVAKKLEKTDLIAKIAPAIGLMGTLIPLGPGLAALGAGDIQNLSQHLLIAFDSAVLGMGSAAVAFTVSKIRRRWYQEDLSNLETLVDTILETNNA